MQQHEKQIVALSVAVTLLGGWVTLAEAEGRLVPACEDELNIVATGSCPEYLGLYQKCNESAPANCIRYPTGGCSEAGGEEGGWSIFCTAINMGS